MVLECPSAGQGTVFDNPNSPGSPAAGSISSAILVLFVGWALGILSSPITDAIRRRSVKRRITRAVVTELQSLQDAFASVVIRVSRRRGVLTHSLLDALRATLMSTAQPGPATKTLKTIDDLLEMDESALAADRALESPAPQTFLSLRVQGLPFLESHLHRLDFYGHETQRRLLQIHAGAQMFNQYADEAKHYHLLTFDEGTSPGHLAALNANIELCYGRAAEKGSELVSQIAALLQSPEMRAR